MPKNFLILIKSTVNNAALLSIMLLSSLLLNTAVQADVLFPKADINAGKALVDAHCIECHARKYGGDGSAIYTREYNKVKTSKGLVAQIRNCNTMLGLKWFEDEEINVAAYLNKTYYKLER